MLISLHIQRCFGLLKSSRMTPPSYRTPCLTLCFINECCPLGIKYDGVALNKAHASFLDQCLDRCMLGYLSDNPNDKSLAADVNSYFASIVADAKRVADKRKFFAEEKSCGSGKRLKRAKQENTDDTSSLDAKSGGSQAREDN